VNYEKLNAAVANAFDVKGELKKEHVRLVIYKDKIIAEKYDTGFDKTVIIRLVHDQKYQVQGLSFRKAKKI
jgi:hypothetical protein